jgi:molybdopterin converting factor subunit 1
MEKVRTSYKIKAFGIAREIFGSREIVIQLHGQTVADLRRELLSLYPDLTGLRSLLIAVNNDYAEETAILNETDEIAVIPPVSGG